MLVFTHPARSSMMRWPTKAQETSVTMASQFSGHGAFNYICYILIQVQRAEHVSGVDPTTTVVGMSIVQREWILLKHFHTE